MDPLRCESVYLLLGFLLFLGSSGRYTLSSNCLLMILGNRSTIDFGFLSLGLHAGYSVGILGHRGHFIINESMLLRFFIYMFVVEF